MPYVRVGRALWKNKRVRRAAGHVAQFAAAAMFRNRRKGGPKANARANMKKRRPTYTGPTRKRTKETVYAAQEYSKKSVAVGRRPRKNLRGAWKMLSQNVNSVVYNYQDITRFGGVSGAKFLVNTSATPTTGAMACPLHLYEITTAPQTIATSPAIRWVPTLSDPTSAANISWAVDSTLSVVNADTGTGVAASGSYPFGNDTLDWVRAKMIFYCPSTIPTKVKVSLIQLKDTRLLPATGTVDPINTAFWQAELKQCMYSPLESGNIKFAKYFKVLMSEVFIMHPKETQETVAATMRELNIFKRLNRRCTYDWVDSGKMSMSVGDTQINTGSTLQTQVHPRARIFLMICAQANNAVSPTATVHPSYDIKLDMKHSQLSS